MTITYSQVDDLRFLSPHIPDLNAGDGMKTGIYKAVEKGNYEMIKFLTSKVKDPSTAQHVGFIPIHIAAYLGHTAIVELLAGFYDNPKDANSMCPHFNTTPMKEVKTYEHFDIVKLSHKFDPEDFQRLYGKEVPTTDDDNLEEEKPEFIEMIKNEYKVDIAYYSNNDLEIPDFDKIEDSEDEMEEEN